METEDILMRGSLFNALVGLAITITLTTGQFAHADDHINLNFKPDGTYAPFKSKTAKQLMTAQEFVTYKAHIDKLNCDSAETILNTAFIRAYPQHSRAKKTEERSNRNHDRWTLYAHAEFMAYGYCNALLDFQNTEKTLAAKSIPLPNYTPIALQIEAMRYANRKKLSEDEFRLNQRNRIIGSIIGYAQRGYVPAILKIAQWVRRGNIFDTGDDIVVEYYLLARARHLGADIKSPIRRLHELGQELTDTRRQDMEQFARLEQSLIRHIFNDQQPL